MNDRRVDIRYEINREFHSLEEFLREYAMNVSARGAFIRTTDPLPVGTKVRLKFTVILDTFETIEGVGRVVHSIEPGQAEHPGIGVVFTSLTERSRDVLTKLFVNVPDVPEMESEDVDGSA